MKSITLFDTKIKQDVVRLLDIDCVKEDMDYAEFS